MTDRLGIQDAADRYATLQARRQEINATLEAERERAARLEAMRNELDAIDRTLPNLGKETLDAFAARQGCKRKPIFVRGTGWLFENGAIHPGSLDFGREPPADPVELARTKRAYAARLLDHEEQAWHKFKADCISQAAMARQYSNCPPPPADAAQQLERGKARIEGLRAELQALDLLIQDDSTAQVARQMASMRAEQRAELEQTYNAINAIQI